MYWRLSAPDHKLRLLGCLAAFLEREKGGTFDPVVEGTEMMIQWDVQRCVPTAVSTTPSSLRKALRRMEKTLWYGVVRWVSLQKEFGSVECNVDEEVSGVSAGRRLKGKGLRLRRAMARMAFKGWR